MSHGDVVGGSLPDQGQLITTLAQAIAAGLPQGWQRFEYRARALVAYLQDEVLVTAADGDVAQDFAPDEVIDLIPQLRAVMYREGAGTWFSATISVSSSGSLDADFDYDHEPAWTRPVEPQWYVQDLARFPRSATATPAWLQARIAEAGHPT